MKNNRVLRLEINAYADSKSSDEYNLILSGKRANWIVKYLSKKGIHLFIGPVIRSNFIDI